MKLLLKAFRSAWFLALLAMFGVALPSCASGLSAPGIAYDGLKQLSVGYDEASPSALDYDFALALVARENEGQPGGIGGLHAKFSEFLAAEGGEDAIRLFHGTTANRGSKIAVKGFRPGGDGAVFFAEESTTAFHFGREAAAGTGARSINALEFTIPRSLAEDLGLMNRQVLGEFRGARPLDIPGASGYERIMTGGNIDAFNQALRDGTISVRRLRGGF